MANTWIDVDAAVTVPVNVMALVDDTDFKTREESVTFDQAGLDLVWNFITTAGVQTQTAVTPTDTGGDYDWVNVGNGMYNIEIPASGGASIDNDTEGFGWFTGVATGILPWVGPYIGFRAAALNNLLVDENGLDAKLDRNADLLESHRGHHSWKGNWFYVDPANGNDSTGDGSRALPYATIQACHDDLVTDSNHDVIFLVAGEAAGVTTHTVGVTTTISKRYVFIRGPGRDFIITRTNNGPTLTITGDGVELSGFQLASPGDSATSAGVLISAADFVSIHNCWILDTQGDGIHISRGSNCQIFDNHFDGTGIKESGEAIHISGAGGAGNADENLIQNNIIADAVGDAILIDDGTTDSTTIRGNSIRGSGGWGIMLTASSDKAHIYENRLASNATGNINDGGTNTTLQDNVALDPFELGAIWIDTVNGVAGTEYPIGTEQLQSSTLAVGKTIADARNITRFEVGSGSATTFTTDMDGYTINGSNYTIAFNGQDTDSLRMTGATVSGTLTATGSVGLIQCRITDATSLPSCGMGDCTMTGDIVLTGTFYLMADCKSVDAPSISLENGSAQDVRAYDFDGNLEVKSMKAGDTLVRTGAGHLTIGSDCTGGTITIGGFVTYTDNVAGGFVVAGGVINDETRFEVQQITGGEYAIDTDANGRVRIVDGTGTGEIDTSSGTVKITDGTITTATFAAGAIDAAAIGADAITNAKIADDAIAAENLATGALTADAFAADALIAATFATGAFTADAFAADALVAATFATDSITADALATDAVTEIAAGVGAFTIETGLNLQQSLQLANAANAGKLSGAATSTVAIRDAADTKDRITMTVDADGNRSVRTVDLD